MANSAKCLVVALMLFTGFYWGKPLLKSYMEEVIHEALNEQREQLRKDIKDSIKAGITEGTNEQIERLPGWVRKQIKEPAEVVDNGATY